MFEMKNGILHRDGKAVFGLGQSYYPSYHEQKVPVPADGDRIGEMQIDLPRMKEAGFNIVRFAALGNVRKINGKVEVDFPLIDAMNDCADRIGLATMIRLQGYSFNFGNYTDAVMLDQNNNEMPFRWWAFVRNCVNHPGILGDNREATLASAAHFKGVPSVVAFQIYNEPTYPQQEDVFFDYNIHSIRAFRKWLAAKGYRTEREVEKLDPPRRRPGWNDDPMPWALWSLFKTERLNDFLNGLSAAAKEAYPVPETLTCHVTAPFRFANTSDKGVDYFRVAKEMDIMGITHYIPASGQNFYTACGVLDLAESAAASFGKHAWLVEYNARTEMTAAEWERETFSAIGSGFKGIMYYEWRADYPFPGSPEPEAFGMVWNDRSKTAKFDRAVALNKLVAELERYFVGAEKERSGVGLFFSEYANAWSGARAYGQELSVQTLNAAYRALRKNGVEVSFVRAEELGRNPLGIRLLVIPQGRNEYLSPADREALDAFEKNGGRTVEYENGTASFFPNCDVGEFIEKYGVVPQWKTSAVRLDVKILRSNGNDFLTLCLTNTDPLENVIPAGRKLELFLPRSECFSKAVFRFPGRNEALSLENDGNGHISLDLPMIATGGFLILSRE